ncbi:MAG TPA: PEP/pyruvate-binding domain-containing protein [Candidatus Hydrogenedentes bacterium]|nr:PEP/pyruvate-binding domain-containing protein [Candidatus Hydrogenedentota bacterium]
MSMAVVFFDAIQKPDAAALGNKGAGLIRLIQAGFQVPKGFCILAAAYRDHLRGSGMLQGIEKQLDTLRTAPPEMRRNLLHALRQDFVNVPLEPTLHEELRSALTRLGTAPLAVRSSATAEDMPGHSFAGQYDTFLGIQGLDACTEAVRKCWASLWTERAFDYRERHGFSHLEVNMAVVVQSLVNADASGVLFTIDPISGSRDHLIIESCFGLGEALVSGKVSPDRYVFSRANLQVIAQTTSEKTIACAMDNGQLVEMPLPDEQKKQLSLNETTARSLAEMGLKAESIFGSPLDIEWAMHGDSLYLLQARPITAIAEKTWEDRQVWTNANTGEVLPDVVTPLTWSLVERLVTGMMSAIASWVGISFDGYPIGGLVGGRVYFNINTMAGMLRRFPGMRKLDITRTLGGSHEGIKIPDEDIPPLSFNPYLAMLKTPIFFARILTRPHQRSVNIISARNQQATELLKKDFSALPEKELAALLDSTIDELMKNLEDIAFSGSGMLWFNYLDKICREWLGGADGEYANRLLAGFGGMDSAEAGLELWRLAQHAHADAAIETVLVSEEHWEAASTRLCSFPSGQSFLTQWDAFMITHGHHTRGELEFFNARWAETPNYILDCIRGYLRSMGSVNPVAHHEHMAQERGTLTKECRARLHNPLKRWWFGVALWRSQRGCTLRENIKSAAVRTCAAIRYIVLALGQHLAERGALATRDDIFFLSLEEILRLVNQETGIDPATLVPARREEYAFNQTVRPPSLVKGRWNPELQSPSQAVITGNTLHGIAVSPGVVTGPARVVLRADSEAQVLPGEILVAPFTDPGWTPYFLPAAAIVMDQGGLLSHGSIVAREFGIPAVVNVGPATKRIHTGQRITVDGTHGNVILL